jgi:hypothetical protein
VLAEARDDLGLQTRMSGGLGDKPNLAQATNPAQTAEKLTVVAA